jgi:hypothetical protein
MSASTIFFYLSQNETQVLIKSSDTSLLHAYSHKFMFLLQNTEIWITVVKERVFYVRKEISIHINWSKDTELYWHHKQIFSDNYDKAKKVKFMNIINTSQHTTAAPW